ncbi:MAG TPA: FHA domain-containing protein [Ktedonobacteraceae bacterium]|jgi:pSer/pThr/pTyr-binding forkhead associated (FHA) protein|nr:FHA domain-containing protein [Ktedonobacteraceae bacterium]
MDKCPYCNADTRPGDNFCLNCGNRLLPSTPSVQQADMIGGATLPASDEWQQPNQGGTAPASPPSWNEADLKTVANTSLEPPTLRADATASPVATMDRIENPAHLVLRSDNGEVLQDYSLDKPEMIIGRAPNSDILLSKDKLTSRRHATIHYENGEYVLRDERSANGTFVNGQQLEEMTPRTLHDGDHVGIGEHELVFHAYRPASSGVDIESMPTVTVNSAAAAEMTYRTREDDLLTATNVDDFSTRSMNGGVETQATQPEYPAPVPAQVPPPTSAPVPVASTTVATPPPATTSQAMARASSDAAPGQADARSSGGGVTFNRLTSLPQPALPDVAPLVAALATLDGQVSSLQEQLNATQEAMRNHEMDIAQTANQLRNGVRNVSERMDNTIADVARSREQLSWAELLQLMEDVMNNPRDIEYVTKLARKARELNKVFQIHQNVLNVLAECTSLLRSLIGEDNK